MSIIRKTALRTLHLLNSASPEGRWKNALRARALRVRNALPRELMVGAGETAVQVGMWRSGNLGRLAGCVGRSGRVVLVEADERNVENLRRFVEAKGLEQVSLVAKGAYDEPGRHRFQLGTSPAFSRLEDDDVSMISDLTEKAFEATREIEVDTLDHILAELGVERVDYAEITVNGLELQVLQGMEETLPRTRRLFLSGYARVGNGSEASNVRTRELLHDHGFRTTVSRRVAPQAVFDHREAGEEWGEMEGHVFAWRD